MSIFDEHKSSLNIINDSGNTTINNHQVTEYQLMKQKLINRQFEDFITQEIYQFIAMMSEQKDYHEMLPIVNNFYRQYPEDLYAVKSCILAAKVMNTHYHETNDALMMLERIKSSQHDETLKAEITSAQESIKANNLA